MFTAANRIGFSKSFDKYFKYNAGDIYLKDKDEISDDSFDGHLFVRIEEGNVIPVNANDMAEYNTFGNNVESPFFVYNSKTKEYDKIEIMNYESMFIDAESMKSFKLVQDKKSDGGKRYYEIPFSSLSSDLEGRLLSLDIKNNGLTDNLYMIMNLLNKNVAKYTDISKLAQDFFEILINAGIRCRHVQAEVILNRLIRDANDIYKRPDFTKFEMPEYKIINLNQAIINYKGATIGTSYQELKRQLLGDALYTTKTGQSYLDPLYAEKVRTDHLKELAARVRKEREAKSNGE